MMTAVETAGTSDIAGSTGCPDASAIAGSASPAGRNRPTFGIAARRSTARAAPRTRSRRPQRPSR